MFRKPKTLAISYRLGESLDLQRLGGADKSRQGVLLDIHLSAVHKLNQIFERRVADVLQEHKRMLVGRHLGEHFTEIRRTNGQNEPMGLDQLALGGKRHVDQVATA